MNRNLNEYPFNYQRFKDIINEHIFITVVFIIWYYYFLIFMTFLYLCLIDSLLYSLIYIYGVSAMLNYDMIPPSSKCKIN